MVGVAQLAERLTVAQEVQGSSPCTHPIIEYGPVAQLVEQGTLNPKVQGSNPCRSTTNSTRLPLGRRFRLQLFPMLLNGMPGWCRFDSIYAFVKERRWFCSANPVCSGCLPS